MNDAVRVVIAGGGTGGHLIPALALARELADGARPVEILMVGTPRGPDRELLPASGFPYRLLPAPTVLRRQRWRNALVPARLAVAVAGALRLVRGFRPDVVVGTGGYASVPVGIAAGLRRIPLLLQEQNSTPGMATRLLARWADRICVQFPETADGLKGSAPVEVTGSPIAPPEPVRAPFAARLDAGRPTVGVFGGSQGARAINDLVAALYGGGGAGDVPASAPNLIWQTGRGDGERIRKLANWPDRFVIEDFFTPMAAVYPLVDVIVCRAGAMSLAEITAWGIASILIPYPHATDDHQTRNARALEALGAAIVVPESGATPERLGALLDGLLTDPGNRRAMADRARSLGRPDAARRVAERVLELAAGGRAA